MTDRGLLATGAVGSVIATLCCFTPLLVILLGAVGLSAWLGWLDVVLLPVLGVFICITVYAVVRLVRRRNSVADIRRT
jgi:mercuric ion transport protein